MRKLASIRKVHQIDPIQGADRIVLAHIDGWQCIVQKTAFNVGDLGVYFEIDSFLNGADADFAAFEQRFSNWKNIRGLRVKTMKMKGVISQGLLMPISELSKLKGLSLKEGDDVTELLGIEKWESAEEMTNNGSSSNRSSKPFPPFIPKTDQERAQNLVGQLMKRRDDDTTYEVTVKLDGSSMTVWVVQPTSKYFEAAKQLVEPKQQAGSWLERAIQFTKRILFGPRKAPKLPIRGVASRNISLMESGGGDFWKVAIEQNIHEKLISFGKSIAVQGELIAPNIQSNYEQVTKPGFYVYDVFLIDQQRYMSPSERRDFIQDIDLQHVPIVGERIKLSDISTSTNNTEFISDLLKFAEGPSLNPLVKREGLVYKENISDYSFKTISNWYLLYKESKMSK